MAHRWPSSADWPSLLTEHQTRSKNLQAQQLRIALARYSQATFACSHRRKGERGAQLGSATIIIFFNWQEMKCQDLLWPSTESSVNSTERNLADIIWSAALAVHLRSWHNWPLWCLTSLSHLILCHSQLVGVPLSKLWCDIVIITAVFARPGEYHCCN